MMHLRGETPTPTSRTKVEGVNQNMCSVRMGTFCILICILLQVPYKGPSNILTE